METSTAGFTAGAASRNVSATAGATPRRIRLPAIGTAAHSQPGRPIPAMPATGTPSTGFLGTTALSTRSESRMEMTADSSTPTTRNGTDCTTIATKIVLHVCSVGKSRAGASQRPLTRTTSTPTATSSG